MSAGADLWTRLERMLHRERHAARRDHRDLMALPIEERVERGETLAGLRFLSEEAGGRIRLSCPDNQAKYRRGDPLRLWHGEESPLRQRGIAVAYESFDDEAHEVVVARDPWKRDGGFDPAGALQLDPLDGSLVEMALAGLTEVRRRGSPEAVAACAVLEHRFDPPVPEDPEIHGIADEVPVVLDASKRSALRAALSSSVVTLVQGPPGSGKTLLLAHAVVALARRGERIVVTAYTHRAVNNALRKIAEIAPDVRVVKAGRATGSDDLRGTRVETVPSMRRLPLADGRVVVCGATIFGLRAAWGEPPWDRVVFDEAAQIPVAYAPCALMLGRRYLLVGDHKQLGPIVQGDHEDPLASMSVFEHLAAGCEPVLLETTYRMNDGINAFPSRAFYEGRLAPAPGAAARRFARVPGGPFDAVFDPERPAVIAVVDHEGFRTRCEPEARLVAALVVDLVARQRLAPRDLAVVSPYRAQLRLIRTLVRRGLSAAGAPSSPLPVIDTVERIQGQEREAVVVSLCASDPDWLAAEQADFFFSPNRLNVTLTRARTKLVVVASPRVFQAFPARLDRLARVEIFRGLWRDLPRVSENRGVPFIPGS